MCKFRCRSWARGVWKVHWVRSLFSHQRTSWVHDASSSTSKGLLLSSEVDGDLSPWPVASRVCRCGCSLSVVDFSKQKASMSEFRPPEVDQCDLVGSHLLLTWNWGRNVNGVQDCGPSYPSQADAIKLIWTKELPFCSQSCRWEVQWLAKPKLDQIVTLSWQELSRGQSVHHEEISMARWVTVVDLMSWICESEKGELFAD